MYKTHDPEVSARETLAYVPGDVYTDSHHSTADHKGKGKHSPCLLLREWTHKNGVYSHNGIQPLKWNEPELYISTR